MVLFNVHKNSPGKPSEIMCIARKNNINKNRRKKSID